MLFNNLNIYFFFSLYTSWYSTLPVRILVWFLVLDWTPSDIGGKSKKFILTLTDTCLFFQYSQEHVKSKYTAIVSLKLQFFQRTQVCDSHGRWGKRENWHKFEALLNNKSGLIKNRKMWFIQGLAYLLTKFYTQSNCYSGTYSDPFIQYVDLLSTNYVPMLDKCWVIAMIITE